MKPTRKIKKGKQNYKIIRIEKELVEGGLFRKPYVKNKKIEMMRFYAANDKEAYDFLKDYKKAANKEYTYYFDEIHTSFIVGKDGKRVECEDTFEFWDREDKARPLIVRMWKAFTLELWYLFIDRPNQLRYWIRDTFYHVKTKHNYNESWSLDTHILDDILWNIPILLKNKHGLAYPYLDMAVKETHKNDPKFDIVEWNKTNHEYTDEEEKLADKFQRESYEKVVEYIKLYYYYDSHGIIDNLNQDEVEFDKKFRHTLPIVPGSYDMFDYKKLSELQQKTWNKIWEWVRTYGQTLWD